jgi:hypothetical protein
MYTTLLWATDGSPEGDHSLAAPLPLLETHRRVSADHCDQRFLGYRPGSARVRAGELERQRHLAAQIVSMRGSNRDEEVT